MISIESNVYYLDEHAHEIQDIKEYFCDSFCRYDSLSLLLINLQFIEINLIQKYQFNNLEKIKFSLNVQDFFELFQYY